MRRRSRRRQRPPVVRRRSRTGGTTCASRSGPRRCSTPAAGTIAAFNGQGRRPWVIRHSFDLRIAGEEGVLELDMEHVRAELLLQGDLERAEVLHVGPEPPPRDEEGMYSCDGPAQFLV